MPRAKASASSIFPSYIRGMSCVSRVCRKAVQKVFNSSSPRSNAGDILATFEKPLHLLINLFGAVLDILMPCLQIRLFGHPYHREQSCPHPIEVGSENHEVHGCGEVLVIEVLLRFLDRHNVCVGFYDHGHQQDNQETKTEEELGSC